MRAFRVKALAIVAGIWVIVVAAIFFARAAKPTPASVERFATEHPLEGKSPAERDRVVRKLAGELNALDPEQRREVRLNRRLSSFYNACTPEEQNRFLDLTLPSGFKQMMEAFNKMEPAKRRAFVDRALADMRKRGDDDPPPDDATRQKIVEHGLRSFYSDASAETKLDFAPLIEQMQKNLQGLR